MTAEHASHDVSNTGAAPVDAARVYSMTELPGKDATFIPTPNSAFPSSKVEERDSSAGFKDPSLTSGGATDGLVIDDGHQIESASGVEKPSVSPGVKGEMESRSETHRSEESVSPSNEGGAELPGSEGQTGEFEVDKELEITETDGPAGASEAPADLPDAPADVRVVPTSETGNPISELEKPEILPSLPPLKKATFKGFPARTVDDNDLKARVAIPLYLSQGMLVAINSEGAADHKVPRVENLPSPTSPLLVFINSRSGGRLGPQLEALLVDLISPNQVFDLSKCAPADVLRYGVGHLEKEAEAGDRTALETRNNMRIMVAGGDGTVGWVLGSIASVVSPERYKVPPVAVIPLGTGNDLSRSFRWGGATTSISRKNMKRWLVKAMEASIATLDSWEVVVKPSPSRIEESVKFPHALHEQTMHDIPEDSVDNSKDAKELKLHEGSFWNYFSLGMDAQVAYGFHRLRDRAPWIASGRMSNQAVYGGYGYAQGWFCTPCATAPIARGIARIAKVYLKKNVDSDSKWEKMDLPSNIRALVILNLQSYAGGRNPWGHPSTRRRDKEGLVEALPNDGVLEIVGLRDGWHSAFVLLDWLTAVRLGQAKAVKLELRGKGQWNNAYLQMDGEPWKQPLGTESDPPAVIEINCNPVQSLCLSRR